MFTEFIKVILLICFERNLINLFEIFWEKFSNFYKIIIRCSGNNCLFYPNLISLLDSVIELFLARMRISENDEIFDADLIPSR